MKGLIDAVRASIQPASYPDRWTGPAAYQSDIYPDNWRANRSREQKGVTHAYQDGTRSPSVPPFVLSAKQLIEKINSITRGQQAAPTPAAKQLIKKINSITHEQRAAPTPATGTNNVALGPRVSKKRTAQVIDLRSSSPKRAKTEERPATPNVIDLTQDKEDEPPPTTTTKFIPTRRLPFRPALAEITNLNGTGTGTRTSKQKRRKDTTTRPVQKQNKKKQEDIHGDSLGTLAKIASKLRASAHALAVDREALRQRWEVDEALQVQQVTDRLAEVNEYFTATENGIHAALEVIEKDLL